MSKKQKRVLVYSPVTHACGHTLDYEFKQPITEQDRAEMMKELQRLAGERCPDCKRCVDCGQDLSERAQQQNHLCCTACFLKRQNMSLEQRIEANRRDLEILEARKVSA